MGRTQLRWGVTAVFAGWLLATVSVAAPAPPYDLEAFPAAERGKISSYAGFARRFVDENGFYAVVLSSAETVKQLGPGYWQFGIPGYTAADRVEVCSAATGVQRRPGVTLEQIQAQTDQFLSAGSPFEKIATQEMSSVETRTVASINAATGKTAIKLPTWIGRNQAGVYLAVGVMPLPAGTIALACSGKSATEALNQLTSLFRLGQGVL